MKHLEEDKLLIEEVEKKALEEEKVINKSSSKAKSTKKKTTKKKTTKKKEEKKLEEQFLFYLKKNLHYFNSYGIIYLLLKKSDVLSAEIFYDDM